MARISSRGWAVKDALSDQEPFTTHGALRADDFAPNDTGRLSGEWQRTYREQSRGDGVRYVVRSYATPIAWVLKDGQVVIPDESYSVTTSKHQGLVRAWLI